MRATGKTTRIIDNLIQELMITGQCRVYDHNPLQNSQKLVLDKVIARLNLEHPGCELIVNKEELIIKLYDYETKDKT
jgi:hypothetical protein